MRFNQNCMTFVKSILIWACLFLPLSAYTNEPVTTIEKSPLDDRQFVYKTLPNNLRVLLVSDAKAHMSAAALVVNTGLYDDPKAFPGMAHFLEHMLFLGTQKFPVEDEFPNYIQSHGGMHNAMTQEEKTSYYFNVNPQSFEGALERFSDFFVAPLFKKDLVDRELNAVDSEFHLNRHKDNRAAFEINNETSNPKHPVSSYFIGNLQTLGYDKPKLYQGVVAFYQQHYFANNMTLVLVGPQSVKELYTLANQYFAAIPKDAVIAKTTAPRPLIFDKAQTAQTILMKSKGQEREFSVTFPIPSAISSDKSHIREKTGHLLAYVLGYEGQGSLAGALKDKQWVNTLNASYQSLSAEQDAFTLHMTVTELGLAHIEDITQYVFNYIALVKERGIPDELVNEIKTINQNAFLYIDRKEPTNFALELADAMHHYEAKMLLVRSAWMENDALSPTEMNYLFNHLTADNMRRFVVSPNEHGNRKTKWYQGQYRVQKLSKGQIKHYSKPLAQTNFRLPTKNVYIPSDLVLHETKNTLKNAIPNKNALNGVILWHHQDHQFKKPKADIVVNFASTLTMSSPKNTLLSGLYTALIEDILMDNFYQAQMAGANIAVFDHPRGLGIRINGYTQKQDLLLSDVLKTLHHYQVDETKFRLMLDRMKMQLMNFQQLTLVEKANTDLRVLLLHPYWHPNDLLEASEKLTAEDLQQFMTAFWPNTQIEMLVHGNYTQPEAMKFAQLVKQEFQITKPQVAIAPVTKVAKLTKDTTHYRAVDSTDKNQVALWYLQNDKTDVDTIAKTMLLGKLLEVPFYQQLRVEQQLGYSLGAGASVINKVSGLMFYIQSPNTSAQMLFTKISLFLQGSKEKIAQLSNEELSVHQQAMLHHLRQPPKTLEEQTNKWWGPIQRGDYEFDYEQKLARALEKVSVEDLVTFSTSYFQAKLDKGQLVVLSSSDVKELGTKITSMQAFKEEALFFPSQRT